MTEAQHLRSFEGHRVVLRFLDGTLVECQLISAARPGLATMWVVTDDGDAFISIEAVAEVCRAADATQAA